MKTPKANFDRVAVADDVQTHQPPFHERLIATRKQLMAEMEAGEDWAETIKAIENTLTDMGVAFSK